MTAALAFVLAAFPAAEPTDPMPGFDFREYLRDHLKFIAVGKHEDVAAKILDRAVSPPTFDKGYREGLPKTLAAVYGTAGKYDGHEVVGYKVAGSRLCRLYVLVYFENKTSASPMPLLGVRQANGKSLGSLSTTISTRFRTWLRFYPWPSRRTDRRAHPSHDRYL